MEDIIDAASRLPRGDGAACAACRARTYTARYYFYSCLSLHAYITWRTSLWREI